MRMTEISENLMLTIDQISHLTGVPKSTLRYWEKSFVEFLKPARTTSNRREYTLEDLDLVKTIKHLLEQEHLTPQGVRLRLGEISPQRRPAPAGKKTLGKPEKLLIHHPLDRTQASKA